MRLTIAIVISLWVTGCRRGATRVQYVGPPISQCAAGRAYMPPAAGSEARVALVPVTTRSEPAAKPPAPEPAPQEAVAEEPDEAAPKDADKPKDKKKKKKPKKKRSDGDE